MSLSSLIWGQSQFDEAVDKATSELRLAEEDIALNLEICDQIRSKSVPPKDATRALKRRLNHKNPNVQLLALGLTDVCVKNGGDHFLAEVASKEFMDNLVSILKIPALNIDVKNKILRLVQNWSVSFEGKYTLGYVGQVYKELNSEGFRFPPKDPALANSAMVDTSTAPDWIDSDVCLRCRTAFTFTNRKHHCRNCGQVFDQQCSSKTSPLPHFGITQEVRVCDPCFTKLNRGTRDRERSHSADFNSGHRRAPDSARAHKHRSVRDFSEAELQRAIQLSLTDSNAASSSYGDPHSNRPYGQWQSSEPPLVDHGSRPSTNGYKKEEEEDPELKAAIEASLREAHAPRPSAPVVTPYEEPEDYVYKGTPTYVNDRKTEFNLPPQPPLPNIPNHDLDPRESDAILTFSQTVQDAHTQGGSDLSRMSNVHELYDRANGLRPKLALSLDDTGRKEQMLSEMHDKLSQAVRLYDHLLTEQISHPTWRAAATSPQTYSRAPARYAEPRRQEVNEWPRQSYTGSSAPVEQTYQNSYSSAVAPPVLLQSRPPVQRQTSYASEYGATTSYVQPQRSTQVSDAYQEPSTPASSYHEPQSQQQPVLSQPYKELPTSQPQTVYHPPTAPHENWSQGPQFQPQHGQASQPQQHLQSQPPQPQYLPTSPPLVPQQHNQTAPPTQSPAQQQYTPTPVLQSPPPVQQQHYQTTSSSSLSRHNTFGHASISSPPPLPSSVTLGRNNTLASYSQPQHTYTPATVTSSPLPAFPTAPTSNPQLFTMYSPPTTGLEQIEKEVSLIDL
ncbi:ubiquitin binding protein [Ramaria rubella]|nr:ubiquitin binding protein [Ramaria rubella]